MRAAAAAASLCWVLCVAVACASSHGPSTPMGKAFARIDNNLVGLINCVARRSIASAPHALLETGAAAVESPASTGITYSTPSLTTATSVSAHTVIPLPIDPPASRSSSSSSHSSSSSAGGGGGGGGGVDGFGDFSSRELAAYFTSLHDNKPIQGDGMMRICRHAGGPFAGVFGKIRRASTSLAAAVGGLMPLLRVVDHDEVVDVSALSSDATDATAAAAAATTAAAAAAAAAGGPSDPSFVQLASLRAPSETTATQPPPSSSPPPTSSPQPASSSSSPQPASSSPQPPQPSSSSPSSPSPSSHHAGPHHVSSTVVATPVVAPLVYSPPPSSVSPVIVPSQQAPSSSHKKIRFDSQHKPVSEAVCDFLVRHVDDLEKVCPGAAQDRDGDKRVSGLIGHALAVALKLNRQSK